MLNILFALQCSAVNRYLLPLEWNNLPFLGLNWLLKNVEQTFHSKCNHAFLPILSNDIAHMNQYSTVHEHETRREVKCKYNAQYQSTINQIYDSLLLTHIVQSWQRIYEWILLCIANIFEAMMHWNYKLYFYKYLKYTYIFFRTSKTQSVK